MKNAKNVTTLEEHLNEQYGKIGTKSRNEFEAKAKAYIIGEMLREERLHANLTQTELAQKIGANKSYISRIENGETDIQLSALFKIFELGLGKKITISVN